MADEDVLRTFMDVTGSTDRARAQLLLESAGGDLAVPSPAPLS